MKRFILTFSLAALAFIGTAWAQHDTRVDAARFAEEQNREYRGDNENRSDREFGRENARAGYEIERLNQEVRELRYQVSKNGSRHIRGRFQQLEQDTDRLTALYRQHRLRSEEARQRAFDLRRDVSHIRTMLHHGWR